MHNKVNRVRMYLVLALLFFLQLTVLNAIKIFGVKPDLGSLFVVFIAVFFGWPAAIEAGFVFGLLKDAYSLDALGANTAALVVTGLAAGFLGPKIFRESRTTQSSIVFAFTLLGLIIHYTVTSALTNIDHINFSDCLLLSFIPVSLYTAAVSLLAFPALIKWFDLTQNAEYL